MAYAQSDQSLCLSLEYSMTVKLPTVQHSEFLSLEGDCTASFESTLVKIPHCWKSHVTAQLCPFIVTKVIAKITVWKCAFFTMTFSEILRLINRTSLYVILNHLLDYATVRHTNEKKPDYDFCRQILPLERILFIHGADANSYSL